MRLNLTSVDWIVCIAALAVNVMLGLYLGLRGRRKADSSSFFLAGRKLTWPIVGASLFSTNIGAEHLVGLSGDSYRYGLIAGTVELATVISLGITVALLLPYYVRNKVFTIPEFLELRYRPEARMCFSGLMVFICVVTKMAFTMYAGALVMHAVMGWGVMQSVLIMGVTTAIITMIGGFGVVAYTDAIHTPIMIVGSGIILFTGLHKIGGWGALCEAVQHSPVPNAMHIHGAWNDPIYPFWGIMLAAAGAGAFYWGMDQVNVQRLLGARDLKQARWGAMFAALLKLTPVFIFALPGVIALALYPNLNARDSRDTFVWILENLLPTGIRGYVLAALLGAVLCSTIAVMNSISTLAVRDFILRFRPQTSEAEQVRFGRLAIVAAMFLGMGAAAVIAWQPEGIYKYLQTMSIYLSMPLIPAIAFGILSKRVTFAGAAASFLSGIVICAIYVIDELLPDKAVAANIFPLLHHPITLNYTYRGFWGMLLITVILFTVSAFTKKTDPAKLQQTTVNWGGKIEPFQGFSDWRLHLTVLGITTVLAYWWLW
jgi:SSS family solute:Na+ symporter